ncbi:MAG: Bax inhibitor-1/YccA family protein [Gammaproteobacteria bacterium]|nr:MAG: Bax inhibitor-1/YccA family protein [Gammaproteobacteria bacterium]UCH39521.1 MAG: Bax inhibitor-1/YccA family protein [Gammaproteobacteria bacterium]
MQMNTAVTRSQEAILATNKVIKNTYILLSMALIFSGFTAFLGVASGIGHGAALVADIVAIAILWFVLPRTANTAAGIPVLFAFTGLLGFGLGPVLNYYLSVNPSIVMTALGGTGVIFLGLSGYALTTRKDFSFLGGFVMIGMLVVLAAAILNIFLGVPALFLALNAAIILIMSAFILWETSSLIHGGETNYIMAAAGLFLSILNLFQALLHLLGAFNNE